jgi:hypothetical protein
MQFLDRLDAEKLTYNLGHYRDSITVLVAVPGAFWEVEFFDDGRVEVEIFRSTSGVEADGVAALERLFREHGLSDA